MELFEKTNLNTTTPLSDMIRNEEDPLLYADLPALLHFGSDGPTE